MKIAIIADPIDEQYAGVHFYTKNLVENLLKIDQKNDYLIIHAKRNALITKWTAERNGRTKEVILPGWRHLPGWPSLRKFILLSFLFWRHKPDVILEPAHIGPFSFLWRKVIKVVTIHDLTPVLFPEHHIWISRFIHKHFLPLILRNADGIITPSESTRKDIQKRYSMQKPMAVTQEAAHPDFKPAAQEAVTAVKKNYDITQPYILAVGTLEPRKNLKILLQAFQKLQSSVKDLQLVIVGQKGWYYQHLLHELNDPSLKNEIVVTGYVSENELPALYTGAQVFVYPSLYEGFGLPPLEAMQCGCPVICSNTSSLPEVVGEAGILFDPEDVSALQSALQKVLSDEKIRSAMRQKGLLQAAKFSWHRCAKETLQFFTTLHEKKLP